MFIFMLIISINSYIELYKADKIRLMFLKWDTSLLIFTFFPLWSNKHESFQGSEKKSKIFHFFFHISSSLSVNFIERDNEAISWKSFFLSS